jgi:hypothetical protein
MTRPTVEDPAKTQPGGGSRRPFVMSVKGGIALLICFLIGVAAAALLIYTLL